VPQEIRSQRVRMATRYATVSLGPAASTDSRAYGLIKSKLESVQPHPPPPRRPADHTALSYAAIRAQPSAARAPAGPLQAALRPHPLHELIEQRHRKGRVAVIGTVHHALADEGAARRAK